MADTQEEATPKHFTGCEKLINRKALCTCDLPTPKFRCQAAIYVRDCFRYTGRGKNGFQMHFNKRQCSRAAVENGLCRIHAKWPDIPRLDWHEFVEERT